MIGAIQPLTLTVDLSQVGGIQPSSVSVPIQPTGITYVYDPDIAVFSYSDIRTDLRLFLENAIGTGIQVENMKIISIDYNEHYAEIIDKTKSAKLTLFIK